MSVAGRQNSGGPQGSAASQVSVATRAELASAYRTCRAVAKREAKNFYYGFLALSRAKSDAMCAMYAFMRRADDISDDEAISLDDRRTLMRRWIAAFHADAPFEAQDRPIFIAVRDVQRRYGVEDGLLDQLVQGTAMDLLPEAPAGVVRTAIDGMPIDSYESVDALERYCYLVASVVGLVTIHIYGFRDARANSYAVDLGKAFQFTNILRDVKEDAERGRIYLPAALLREHGATPQDVLAAANGAPVSGGLHAAMEDLGRRAAQMYTAADGLVPLLDEDSRSAMRVLIRIYASLLQEIQAAGYDVFSSRIRVSTGKKLRILLVGLLRSTFGSGGA